MPVEPAQTIFAQYRHISGVAAGAGERTVSLSRVQLINSLLDGLRRVQSDAGLSESSGQGIGDAEANALIRDYAARLHEALAASPEAFGSLGGTASAGMIFNISV